MSGLQIWIDRFWQDLQPTPGRLGTTLRIVLATVLAVILVMTLRIPVGAFALYFIFLVARESPAVSLRSGVVALVSASLAVAAQLAVVIVTDNDPIARVLGVALIAFIAGMIMTSTIVPSIGVILGFVFCSAIANWEFHKPAEILVKSSLWLIASCALGIGCAVLVEYAFGLSNPVKRLEQQLQMRYKALEKLFHSVASGAAAEDVVAATVQVGRLATAGQSGMQELYNAIVERKLDAGALPVAPGVHITMLAQLMDLAVAFGSQIVNDPQIRERCARVAEQSHQLGILDAPTKAQQSTDVRTDRHLTLLDRIETVVHDLRSMPRDIDRTKDKEAVALASKGVPLLVPNAIRHPDNVAFALKLSLCATICYVFYHAVDWTGIGTCVTTVIITALSTRGAINQKLAQRVLGSIIGGLMLAIGATAFLFPHMDSITSLVVLVAAVCFVSAWCATGRRFSYVGLQIALAFYLVAFKGFGPSTELAPARDRFAGIMIGLIVMWIVFGEIWPVRTLTLMRRRLDSVVRNTAILLTLGDIRQTRDEDLRHADALRDQVGKAVAELRTLNDAAEFEFGSDRQHQTDTGHLILRAAFAAAAMFWNELAFLRSSMDDEDLLNGPRLIEMRRALAAQLNRMSETLNQEDTYGPILVNSFFHPNILEHSRYGDYVYNARDRFYELVSMISDLNASSRTVGLPAPSIVSINTRIAHYSSVREKV
jgi:multidrug resistance protein MdtO